MTEPLPPMDRDVARRVLARLPHARRFPVGRLVPPVGLLSSSVRSLPELELALRPEPRSLAGLHLHRLAAWIEDDVGDALGATEVREAARAAGSYVEALQAIHRRVAARVADARRTLEGARQVETAEGEHE